VLLPGDSVIRILVVADIRLYRDGLVEILSREQELLVVGTADCAAGALAQTADLSPDIILVDQAMPESVPTVRALLALCPSVKIISLAVRENEREVIACAEAGVSGYVPREASLDDLLAVVDSVGRGELLCSPQVAASLLRRVAWRATGGSESESGNPLTGRELEIVRLIEQGLSNKEIAGRLGIEVATVKNHVHNLLEKLRVHRRGEAASYLRGREPVRRASRGVHS
jgi:two-component system, NarL family, nitrate/nitrite response regulator NarL